jgi:2-oxoisovalerate dehydrogenase E2 component (dihydrolipoyl transacylase)
MSIFKLPDLGEGLPDAVIREWYVKEGDTVEVDQPLVAMETAKALVDVPASQAGIIEKRHGNVGDTIDTGAALITFQSDGKKESPEKDAGTVVGHMESSDKVIGSDKASMQQLSIKNHHSGIKATPQVRMLAQQLGVNLTRLNKGIPITADDVKQEALALKTNQRVERTFTGKSIPLTQVRRAMVQSMEHSLREIVPVTLMDDANIEGFTGDMTVHVLRAVAKACKKEPSMNAFFDSVAQCIYPQVSINIGLAVDTPEGLYVPVMNDIANRSDEDLRSQINRFKDYATHRSFPAAELKGATILVTNFGTFAGRYANPVLVPPLVSIIGIGKARIEPTVIANEIKPCKILPLSVTADHRAVTGGELSRFLATLIENLRP